MAPTKNKKYNIKLTKGDWFRLAILSTLVFLVWRHEEHKCVAAAITYLSVSNMTQSLLNKGIWAVIIDTLNVLKEMNNGTNKNRPIP